MQKNDQLKSKCALCQNEAVLENSHIIPKFIYDWQKETSGNGYLRFAPEINRRVQDGAKSPMLCGLCEDILSVLETKFSREVFHPFVKSTASDVKYDSWLLRFSVSVCWRILVFMTENQQLQHFRGRWAPELANCEETWRSFLLGKRSDEGTYHVHMLRWNGVVFGGGPLLPNNINRYLRRTVGMDVACSDQEAFIYGKLGPILLFGMVNYGGSKQWRGTRIYMDGKLKTRDCVVPLQFRDYIFGRAQRMQEQTGKLSQRQLNIIENSFDIDRLAKSDTFAATNMDYDLFGEDALVKGKDEEPPTER